MSDIHPIPFLGPLAFKVHAKAKTETRRVMYPQPTTTPMRSNDGRDLLAASSFVLCVDGLFRWHSVWGPDRVERVTSEAFRSPFKRGDVLWVREPYAFERRWNGTPPRDVPRGGSRIGYVADGKVAPTFGRVRPAMHMPRWVCRRWLKVTEVRAERLGDITDAGAVAEGYANRAEFLGGEWARTKGERTWVFAYTFRHTPQPVGWCNG